MRNSKSLVGNKLNLDTLSLLLHEPKISAFSKAHNSPTLILSFWSVDCAPCLKKLSKLSDLGPETLVFPINTDGKIKALEAQETLQQLAPDYSFLQDEEGVLLDQLKIDYLPTNVVLNKEGVILKIEIGER